MGCIVSASQNPHIVRIQSYCHHSFVHSLCKKLRPLANSRSRNGSPTAAEVTSQGSPSANPIRRIFTIRKKPTQSATEHRHSADDGKSSTMEISRQKRRWNSEDDLASNSSNELLEQLIAESLKPSTSDAQKLDMDDLAKQKSKLPEQYPNNETDAEKSEISNNGTTFAGGFQQYANNGGAPSLQFICGTAVSFEWLFERLVEKFKCWNEQLPQWIVEKMSTNSLGSLHLDRTTVLRVTLGWDNGDGARKFPKSVVLKVAERGVDDDTSMELSNQIFQRECYAYEWLSKQKRINIPRVFVVKRHWSKSGNALIVMEDLGERPHLAGESVQDSLNFEGVRDLLRTLAHVHAVSMKDGQWRESTLGALPLTFYKRTAQFAVRIANICKLFSEQQPMDKLDHLFDAGNLERLASNLFAGAPECLVHGNPFAKNIFTDENDQWKVLAVINWTQAHSGCFGEDVAKAICWNLNAQDRHAHLLRLLQYYHYNLLKKFQSLGQNQENSSESFEAGRMTLDQVKDAYLRFVPLAAVSFLAHFASDDEASVSVTMISRARQLITEAVDLIGSDSAIDSN